MRVGSDIAFNALGKQARQCMLGCTQTMWRIVFESLCNIARMTLMALKYSFTCTGRH